MEEFLIGAGLALLLALLAWSDSIRNLHRETLEIEKEFSQKRKLNLSKIRTIIRTEGDSVKRIKALNELIKNANIKEVTDVNIIEQLINLDSDRCQLEKKYEVKYCLVIILTHLFLISGIVNSLIKDTSTLKILCILINAEFISILLCLSFQYYILFFLVRLNNIEKKYKTDLNNLMDRI